MLTGTIKRYDFRKGFGFITEDKEGKDYFFHKSEWKGKQQIRQGVVVNFESKDSEKGTQAANVLPVEAAGNTSEKNIFKKKPNKSAETPKDPDIHDIESRLLAIESTVSTWKTISIVTLLIVALFIAYQFSQ